MIGTNCAPLQADFFFLIFFKISRWGRLLHENKSCLGFQLDTKDVLSITNTSNIIICRFYMPHRTQNNNTTVPWGQNISQWNYMSRQNLAFVDDFSFLIDASASGNVLTLCLHLSVTLINLRTVSFLNWYRLLTNKLVLKKFQASLK
jgi:hypothetical protein